MQTAPKADKTSQRVRAKREAAEALCALVRGKNMSEAITGADVARGGVLMSKCKLCFQLRKKAKRSLGRFAWQKRKRVGKK